MYIKVPIVKRLKDCDLDIFIAALKKKFNTSNRVYLDNNNPYIYNFNESGSGTDIEPIVNTGVPGFSLVPESQRYFDYHHSPADTFDKVNKRELELGGAALAAFIYLVDQKGLQ